MFNIKNTVQKTGVKKILFFEETSSTNKIACRYISFSDEFLVIALKQKNGKGRFDRVWHSPFGGVYFSYVLRKEQIDYAPHLSNISACMSVMNYLVKMGAEEIEYRWPNDVLIKGKKFSGILSELVDEKIVIGIGLNLNNEDFTQEIRDKSVSLFQLTNIKYKYENAVYKIVNGIKSIKYIHIKDFLENNKMIGKNVSISTRKQIYRGKVIGFSENGEIIIKSNNSDMAFIEGDVNYLRGENE